MKQLYEVFHVAAKDYPRFERLVDSKKVDSVLTSNKSILEHCLHLGKDALASKVIFYSTEATKLATHLPFLSLVYTYAARIIKDPKSKLPQEVERYYFSLNDDFLVHIWATKLYNYSVVSKILTRRIAQNTKLFIRIVQLVAKSRDHDMLGQLLFSTMAYALKHKNGVLAEKVNDYIATFDVKVPNLQDFRKVPENELMLEWWLDWLYASYPDKESYEHHSRAGDLINILWFNYTLAQVEREYEFVLGFLEKYYEWPYIVSFFLFDQLYMAGKDWVKFAISFGFEQLSHQSLAEYLYDTNDKFFSGDNSNQVDSIMEIYDQIYVESRL